MIFWLLKRRFSLVTELIPYFIQDKFNSNIKHGRFDASTMFIDIVGFTSLTSRLLAKGNIGAEELSLVLNMIFEPLVDTVYSNGGFIPYYAGDAFLAVFPLNEKNTVEHFILTALSIQKRFKESEAHHNEKIEIKIGISSGNLEWGIVGNSLHSYYFNGFPISKCAYAQSLAVGGEIIMDQKLVETYPDLNYEKLNKPGFVKLLPDNKLRENDGYSSAVVDTKLHLNKFLPKQILDPNLQGEFRTVVSVFIAFKGSFNHQDLDAFSSLVLELVKNFSGYFKEIDYSDKGALMLVLFGAPVSYENNIERALEFISQLKEGVQKLDTENQIQFKVGATNGICFTGMIGGKAKKQYAALGNKVNIASRLMGHADWGEVLVDEEIQKNRLFTFQKKGEIQYKGVIEKIPTFVLEGKSNEVDLFEGEFIGRSEEIAQISQFIDAFTENLESGGAINIFGEAGVGKSRLIFEVGKELTKTKKVNWAICQTDQILRKPFNPLIYFLRNEFKQNSAASTRQNQQYFEQELEKILSKVKNEKITKELLRTKSIFAGLLGLKTKGTLWEELDAKGRFDNAISCISNLFIALAEETPLVVEIEDGHWFDESTISFLRKFIYHVREEPIVLIMTSRYLDNGTKPDYLTSEIAKEASLEYVEIDLNLLSKASIKNYAESKLGGKISEDFFDLLQRTTNGNPFYLEQMLEYFEESNLIEKLDDVWMVKDKNIKLSNSINAVLMARVDRLSELVKETVKAAAVIGREFDIPVLQEVMKSNDIFVKEKRKNSVNLIDQIETAEKVQIWKAINELKYIFKHSLLRETVYDMQLNSRLKELHGLIGNAIEVLYDKELEGKYADLAFHFDQSKNHKKALNYVKKAADSAKRNYQNNTALRNYEKALDYIDKKKKPNAYAKILLKQAEILELIGQWDKSIAVLSEATSIVSQSENMLLLAMIKNEHGKILNLKGEYKESYKELEVAMGMFEGLDDNIGLFKTYGNLGDLYFRQGEYENAKEYFLKSIALSKEFKKSFTVTQIVSNLGLTYMNQSEYEKGIKCQEDQLEICKEIGDRNGMAILYTNIGIVFSEMGDSDKAMNYFEKGLALSEELGNKQMKAIAIGSIGSIQEAAGAYDKALDNFNLDLKLCKELGDKRGIAIVHNLLGDLLIAKGKFADAKFHLDEALELSGKINYQKGMTKALISLADLNAFLREFNKAEKHLKQSIGISNEIQYLPSLEESQQKLFDVYLIQNLTEPAAEGLKQLKEINPDKHAFGTLIREAKLTYSKGEIKNSLSILKKLETTDLSDAQQAEVYLSLSKIDNSYKEKALTYLNNSYERTPHYHIKQQLQTLENEV